MVQRSIRSWFRREAPLVHVLTVHHREPRWVRLQLAFLDRHLGPRRRVWAVAEGIPAADLAGIDVVVEHAGKHPERLNHLAQLVLAEARDHDRLLFLDSDAWPVAPLDALIAQTSTIAAVRRLDNGGDPQPHPCFALTSVGFWRGLPGDWRQGPRWRNDAGWMVSDPGARLLRRLERKHIRWRPLDRRNAVAHGVWFGLYGDDATGPLVYHHGAGSRRRVERLDIQRALEEEHGAAPDDLVRAMHQRLAADQERARTQAALSEQALAVIERDARFWEQSDWPAPLTHDRVVARDPAGASSTISRARDRRTSPTDTGEA